MSTKILHLLKGALLFFVGCYLVSWIIVYSVVLDFDYSHLFHYMQHAWYGGFVVPTFIQLFAVGISVLLTLAFTYICALKK